MNTTFKFLAATAFVGSVATPALADGHTEAPGTPNLQKYETTVGLGVGYAPDFIGSDDYDVIPLLYGKVQRDEYWVQLEGLELSANLIDSRRFNAGPVVNYRFGRDDDVENDTISRLREVDDSVEVGIFASYNWPNVTTLGDKITLKGQLLHDINDGHEGVVGEIGLDYGRPFSEKLYLTAGISTTYGSDDYMDSFFSVDSDNANRSGLAQYEAEGGFQDVGISLRANYAVDDQWGVFGMIGYSQLIGDASDSPIVDQGDEGQTFAGLGLTYRF